MAISGKRTTTNVKVGLIMNDRLGGLIDGFDLATGFTAIAGETAGECDGVLIGDVFESTSSEPDRTIWYLFNKKINKKYAKFKYG